MPEHCRPGAAQIPSDVSEAMPAGEPPNAPLTSEARLALAHEAIQLVKAGAAVLAGAGLAVVAVYVAVGAHPAGLTVAPVPVRWVGRQCSTS